LAFGSGKLVSVKQVWAVGARGLFSAAEGPGLGEDPGDLANSLSFGRDTARQASGQGVLLTQLSWGLAGRRGAARLEFELPVWARWVKQVTTAARRLPAGRPAASSFARQNIPLISDQ